MTYKRLAALLAALLMAISCVFAQADSPADEPPEPVSEAQPPADETPTPVPETPTPVPETPTPEPETPTPEPETATPEPETATPEPETATPEPETPTPVPETATPEPETATPEPETATLEAETATPEAETATPEPETATPEAETATPEAETATPEAETATPEAETATPEAETATPEPETATPEPETATPEAETATPEPETATPEAETATPRPDYPRAVFTASEAIVDAGNAVQGGQLLVALPIAFETEAGVIIRSNAPGSVSGWTPDAAEAPGYFDQTVISLPYDLEWTLKEADAALTALFDMAAGATRIMVAYAPQDNDWNMAPGTVFNTGYAIFRLDIPAEAPVGQHQLVFVYQPNNGLVNTEDIEFIVTFSIGAAPVVTETPGPTEEPGATDGPPATEEPGPELSGEGSVMVGQMTVQTLKVGQSGVTMAIPVSYADSSLRVYSNRDDEGNVLEPGSEDFSQEIVNYIEWLEVEIPDETAADSSFPFMLSEQGVSRVVIENGENRGYAVFSGLTVKKGLSNGTAAVPFTVNYIDTLTGELQSVELTALVNITGASSGYYGGGGGGGGYSSPTTAPQARVIVESIATDPREVQAGDTFDLVFMLRNTSARQFVQNMRVTIGSEEDALVPQSGSNTLYIDRIDAEGLYELRYPVRASLEVPDRPLKVDITVEYEDAAVSAQSAMQQMVINVAQRMRLNIGEPVMDASSLYAGDSVDVTLQVVNEGRTMLYNVTVAAQSGDEGLILPSTAYLGNMEGGTSRRAELSLTPTRAGDYAASLLVTWEDAVGERFSDTRDVSFTAMAEETSDIWSTPGYEDYSQIGAENEKETDLGYILELMPWWIYAAAAGLYLLIVVYIGVSVRARRRKALEDEEDEIE